MGGNGEVVVFAGPSLHGASAAERAVLDGCDLWPPAARGDVLRALARRPRALVLIDGYFHRVPAVTHQELLYALDGGTPVFGAASMGALRAAELGAFGLRGVGTIAAAFGDGTLEGDDEVALLHAPAEYGYAPIGFALVEARFALQALGDELDLSAAACEALIGALKALSFTERTPAALVRAAEEHLGARSAARLREHLRTTSVKRDDAFAAIACARAFADGSTSVPRRRSRAATGYLTCFKEMALPAPGASAIAGASAITLQQALAVALVLHPAAAEFVASVRRRALAAAAARYGGIDPATLDVESRAHTLAAALPDAPPWLPEQEVLAEARLDLLASHPAVAAGWPELARRFGCSIEAGGAALLDGAEAQPDLVPAWDLARRFAWSPALLAAVQVARDAGELLGCWRRVHGGARIEEAALREVAGEIWRCDAADVARRGAARGLIPAAGLGDGLREALELVAAAERLPRPINDYPAARAALCAVDLEA